MKNGSFWSVVAMAAAAPKAAAAANSRNMKSKMAIPFLVPLPSAADVDEEDMIAFPLILESSIATSTCSEAMFVLIRCLILACYVAMMIDLSDD